MDPCPFVRVLVGDLTLKFPVASRPTFSGIHPSTTPCYCKVKLSNFPAQVATIPLLPQDNPDGHVSSLGACFNLNKSDIEKLNKKRTCLKIAIYTGRRGTSCGLKSAGKLLGSVSVALDLKGVECRGCVFRNGWVVVGENAKGSSAQLHLNVRAEPDPRFVFGFDGEPECSPQVFQIQGNIRQPVFTCKFSLRNSSMDRNLRSRSSLSEPSSSRNWLSSLGSDKEQQVKERKGWSITVHDLSGSPVALASMVTPFVPSPGSDRVSRSNPGAWLILRPGDGTWKPWGRLEAWLERGTVDGLGHRFELLPDATASSVGGITLTNSTLSTKKGGKFTIDVNNPSSSGDFGLWPQGMHRGFVMSSTVEGVGRCSKPEVEVGVQHVTCTEDAAVFVALAAAMDLSIDACRLFSKNLRKELRQQSQDSVV